MMLSRVADDIYWFARYLQRAENTARLVAVHTDQLMDLPRHIPIGWEFLIKSVGAESLYTPSETASDELSVTHFLLADENNPGSVVSSLRRAREILRTIRDAMPREAWEQLNSIYYHLNEATLDSLKYRRDRQDFLRKVIDQCTMISGVLFSNMSRDESFRFFRIGSTLEQADMTTRILDAKSAGIIDPSHSEELKPFENIQWMSILRSLSAYHMYRRHKRARVSNVSVVDFLLKDAQFPRSVNYCVSVIQSTIKGLPYNRRTERAVERAQALVRDANVSLLLEDGIDDFLDSVQVALGEVHQAIQVSYFEV